VYFHSVRANNSSAHLACCFNYFSGIAIELDSKPGSIFTLLSHTGEIAPNKRKPKQNHLTLEERESIRAGLSAKLSTRTIARMLNGSPSIISREVNRNRFRRYYKAVNANNRARRMAKRPKPCLLKRNTQLNALIVDKLQLNWSPEQISGWLIRIYP
jgi:hypothetical protein